MRTSGTIAVSVTVMLLLGGCTDKPVESASAAAAAPAPAPSPVAYPSPVAADPGSAPVATPVTARAAATTPRAGQATIRIDPPLIDFGEVVGSARRPPPHPRWAGRRRLPENPRPPRSRRSAPSGGVRG